MPTEKNQRILIVDDQESIHLDFDKILGTGKKPQATPGKSARSSFFGEPEPESDVPALGFEVTHAMQGEQALELVGEALEREQPFAMAFVDVRMPPGLDGVQTIKKLWELDPDVQVVICTAFSDYSFDDIVRELGESDHLLILKKPFDPVEVRQLASAMTEKWNTRRDNRRRMGELREANRRAEAANRAKSDFLANMSHEIRTPMNAVLGYIDLLTDVEATTDDRQKYGEIIRRSSEHLLTILNDILDISRIEASRLVVNAADFNPFEVAREVVSLLHGQASERDLDLGFEVLGAIPEVLESDLVRVRQVLLNLLGNAIKFTVDGSVKLVLHLDEAHESDHRYLCFDVVDTGSGIASEKLESIFEPFTQADSSLVRRHGGTGLGLTISKRLALLLGGDIEVKSVVGQGSTFSLKLYAGELRRACLREYTPAECSELPHGPEPKPDEGPLDARILVVEDVPLNQRLMAALLRKAGCEVELADDGQLGLELALAAFEAGRPHDILLMDMQMPVLDGYEATRRLRARGYPQPIVALTAHAMSSDRAKCIEAGCNEYLTKPVDRQRLLALCRRLVQPTPPAALPRSVPGEVEARLLRDE